MIRRLSVLSIILLLIALLGAIPHGSALAVPRCGTDHTICTPTPTATPVDTPTPQPTTTPGAGMATAVTTFAFASTLQSWSSIAALASGETNGLDTVNGNPADALFGKLVGKTKASTAGAGMKLSQSLTAWGVPAGATVTAVSVALDKKCVTAPGSAIGSGSFNTKLNLNAGASTNTGPTQTLSTTADTSWTTLAAGSNAALSGLSDSTLTHLLEVDILYTLSTTSSAATGTTWQIDWDNVVVTVTYTINVPTAPGTPTGTRGDTQSVLSWTDNANNGGASVTDHHVYLYAAPSGGSPIQTIDTGSASTGATVTGLTDGTASYFEVTASNSAGESAHSTRSAAVYPTSITHLATDAGTGTSTGVSSTVVGIGAHNAGDLMVMMVATTDQTGSGGLSLSDTQGNSWAFFGAIHDGTDEVAIWYAIAATTTGGITTPATISGATSNYEVAVDLFRSSAGPLALDASGTGSSVGTGTVSTTQPTAYADELDVTVGLNTTGIPTGFTNVSGGANTGGLESWSEVYQIVGPTGVQSATWPATGTESTAILTFRATGPVISRPGFGMSQAVKRAALW